MTNIDISPESVERTINDFWERAKATEARQAETMIRALSAALTQSRAETAAAYELAAKLFDDGTNVTGAAIGRCIRALATPDHTAALDNLIAEAEALAVEKTAAMVRTWRNTTPMTGEECANAILAMIGEKK